MIVAIDIDKTCIQSKSWVYKALNIKPDLVSLGRKKPFKLNKSENLKPTNFNKIFGVLNPKKYYQVEGASSVINKLYQNNIILFVSSRPIKVKSVKYLTIQNFEDAQIKYDAIFLNCTNKDKFCRDMNVDLFIDNSYDQCKSVSKNTNTKTICLNSGIKKQAQGDISYFNNWQTVYGYANHIMPIVNSQSKPYINSEFVDNLKQDFKNYTTEQINKELIFDYQSVDTCKKLKQKLEKYISYNLGK